MDINEIKETPIWGLYEIGRNYHRRVGIYTDTDRNYRFYRGNQWEGAKLGDVEPIQINFIQPIVKYKVAVVHDNLYAINYSSLNFESREFHRTAERYCKLLNGYASRVWERSKMDFIGRRVTTDAAVNDEGIIYVDFDRENMLPVNEIIKKNDVYYGNENSDDIQSQPYILIRKRMPVVNAIEFAKSKGVNGDKLNFIIGDNDTFEQSGEAAKIEVDNMVTIVFKLYKKDGSVHFSAATRWVEIVEDADMGIALYPIAHLVWAEKEGSARGEGEVRSIIPNQIEVNRIAVRRALTVKFQAFPRSIADRSKIANPQALTTVGGTIFTNGQPVDDVHKIVGTITPAQMSPDVKLFQDDLIQVTRELAGAGEAATGQIDPESASGRAILAVQNANRSPLSEQRENYKMFVEDIAHIWLEYLIAFSSDGLKMEEEVVDPITGEEYVQLVGVPQSMLKKLQATVKIDITPRSEYDKFARERTMENFLLNGFFGMQRLGELKAYVSSLDDDSVTPKQKLLDVIDTMEAEQRKIAMIDAQSQMMQQRAEQFLMEGPDGQAEQIVNATSQIAAQEDIDEEDDLDDEE